MGFLDRLTGKNSSERTEILEIEDDEEPKGPNKFIIDEVYMVQGFPVIRGRVLSGQITMESVTRINNKTCGIAKMQANKKELNKITRGEQCSMILKQVDKYHLREKQILEFF